MLEKKGTMNDILESDGIIKYAQSGQVPIKKNVLA